MGTHKAGDGDDPAHFYEPGGLSAAGTKLYVADTNNHKIKVVDLKTEAVKTLALADLTPPRLAARRPSFPNATTIDAAGRRARARKVDHPGDLDPAAQGLQAQRRVAA